MAEALISLNQAARIAGVSPSTLQRWARAGVIPVKKGRWTTAAAAQARVVGRMRERGHSLESFAARFARAAWRSATSRTCCPGGSASYPARRPPSRPTSRRR